jgi:hypothetical protein
MGYTFQGAAVCAFVAIAFAAGLIIGVIASPRPEPGRYLDLADSRNVAEVVSLCAMWPEKFSTKTADMEACQIAGRHFMLQTFHKE